MQKSATASKMVAFSLILGAQGKWMSIFFTPEGNDLRRSQRQSELSAVICKDHASQEVLSPAGSAAARNNTCSTSGCCQVPAMEGLWATPKVIVWHFVFESYFALVGELEENLLLASATLQTISTALAERLGQ